MAKLLVLFVHGLAGNTETWGSFKKLIESDSSISSAVDVEFFSFPTNIRRKWFTRSLKIQEIAVSMATTISLRYAKYDRILLVCHSMGGLVAKRYILERVSESANLVVGVIFFATPHTGAALARAANLIFSKHYHLRQMRRDTDFIDLVNRDWSMHNCDSRIDVRYVVAGQDQIVDLQSATGSAGARYDLIPDKGHIDIVKPTDNSELAYLIVRKSILRLTSIGSTDLDALATAIDERDSYVITALVANKGRSWIESSDFDRAVELLEIIVEKFPPKSQEAVWSKYLVTIARLFKDRASATSAFTELDVANAEASGLAPLIEAERMEFARKRGDKVISLQIANKLKIFLETNKLIKDAGSAYAFGTTSYLISNFLRYGGNYAAAKRYIEKAKSIYRPSILSHQIELAHCQYASTVCATMEGMNISKKDFPVSLNAEFRRFAEALITLTSSHVAWAAGNVGEAMAAAKAASVQFSNIGFAPYAARAGRLFSLLEIWQRFEYGATIENAVGKNFEYASIIRGMAGDPQAQSAVKDWINSSRASQVLGMLQFASAYNPDWSIQVEPFLLPPIICDDGEKFVWIEQQVGSLAEADVQLRASMGIAAHIRLPLIAD